VVDVECLTDQADATTVQSLLLFLAREPKHNCLRADFRHNLARYYCEKAICRYSNY
jgi:hypothetical protein